MGEGVPGGAAARVLDAEAARVALVQTGATRDLDGTLAGSAEILLQRFGADMSLVYVARRGQKLFWAPSTGPFSADSVFDNAASFQDSRYSDLLEGEDSALTEDLATVVRTPAQEMAFSRGIRSSLRATLRNERREMLGFALVGAAQVGRFSESDRQEFESFAAALAWFVRPGVLLEVQSSERLLIEEEAKLLAAMAEAESEDTLVASVCDGVRSALNADLALVMVESTGGGPARLCSSPGEALTAVQWAAAKSALGSGENGPMTERSRDQGAFVVPDLVEGAETPVEQWMRDSLGMRSIAASTRSHHWGGLGLGVCALRRAPGPWAEAQRQFLARLTRVMEICVERLRRGEIAVEHAVELERQADMLATGSDILEVLSDAGDIGAACGVISGRLREFFRAEHVAFGICDLESRTRTVLGASSEVMAAGDLSLELAESDVEAYAQSAMQGTAEWFADLASEGPVSAADARAYASGLRSLMRAPFRLSDGILGMVSVGSREPNLYGEADAERLLDLCRPVGVAIDRVRLLARMDATSAVLDTKTRVLAALVPEATLESVGQVFVDETQELFGATHAVAAVFSSSGVEIAGMAGAILERQPTADFLVTGEPDATWRRVLHDGVGQVVPQLEAIERTPAEQHLYESGIRCIMRAPIVDSGGRVRGMVTAGTPEAYRWADADLATFTELAQSLGLVFERTQWYEAAEERAEKIQALTRLLSTLNLQSPPEEVARLFARQVREYLDADAVMLYAFDPDSGQRLRVAFDARVGHTRTPDRVSLEDSTGYRGTLEEPRACFSADEPEGSPEWLREAASEMGYGSAVCVRLDAAGEAVGMIAAGSVASTGMTANELEILAAVAPPLAMVLERARAVTSLRLQTQRTQAVLDILAALGPADTLEMIAEPVANALRVMYAADHCGIGVLEEGIVTLVGVDSTITSWQNGDTVPAQLLFGAEPLTGPVLHVVGDMPAEPAPPGLFPDMVAAGMRSSMRVLIGTAASPLGVVTVGSRQKDRFNDLDARQLAQIVQPLAVAARYFRSRRETALRTQRLETTNRILTRLSAGGTPEHLARSFLSECRVLFGSRHALAVQFDHEANTGRLLAIDTDYPAAEALPHEFALEEMHTARMVRQPTPQLVQDARQETDLNVRHLHLIDAGVFSAIRAPLLVHDTVRGAVSLWKEGAGQFSEEDAELLGTLTRPLALALEKALALASLGESELKYRSLVAQADEMIFLFDPATLRILDANSFTSRTLAYDPQELVHLTLDRVFDATAEDIAANVAIAIADGELHLTDARFLRSDGSAVDVDAVASMVTYGGREAVLVLARDVSERKALLRQLIQSQKMDSLGAMAGAVAHDFNNLLTTILGFAGLLKRSRNMDLEERENLALIEDAARRAADLTGRLLSFSRGGLVRFGRVDLRTVIEDTLQLAEPTMHTNLRVTRLLPETPVYVEGDAGQLQQSVTNIVLNARDAMPEGGDIDVTLEVDGTVATVRITDTGPGMDEETRMRIFEPFYTTKPLGSGTGLGMAITYGIIQGHHGDIAVRSTPGVGTQFTITLPVLEVAEGAVPADAFNAGEGNLVLVVDDDAMVRRTTTATLTELGYNVVEAPGGSTAVEILRARPDRFSAVLLDLVMPGMTGSETFRALTAVRPDLPVVVCTGYAADSHIDTDVKRRIAGLVQKPFTAERLARALVAAGAMPTRESRI